MIEHFYTGLEEVYNQRINESRLNGGQCKKIKKNINSLKEELSDLNDQLHSGGSQLKNSIRKICLLDLKTILDKQRGEIYGIIDNRKDSPVDIQIDESLLYQINQDLAKYISLNYQQEHSKLEIELNVPQQPLQVFKKSFEINVPDYFVPNAKKFLHFFQNDEKKLHLLDLSRQERNFKQFPLNIDFKIPHFHKSCISPFGEIYLSGGSHPENIHKKLSSFYKVSLQNQTLTPLKGMIVPRSSHCLIYMKRYIYAIGGITSNSQFTQKCERYDISHEEWQEIAELNYNAVASCCCSFNDKYIFKFGGIFSPEKLNTYIEMYSPKENRWVLIDAKISESPEILKAHNFKFLSTSACIQINQNQMLIFGGYDEQNQSSTQSFLLEVFISLFSLNFEGK